MMVSLAMIVRDAEHTLGDCLESVRPFVDEVNLSLAGESEDDTIGLVQRLAREPGAPIRWQEREWHDDFARARNESFAMVSGHADWIMFCDADDVLIGGEHLRDLIAHASREENVIEVLYRASRPGVTVPLGGEEGRWCVTKRLLRNDREWTWRHPLHEQVGALGERVLKAHDPRILFFDHTRTSWRQNLIRNERILYRLHIEHGLPWSSSNLTEVLGAKEAERIERDFENAFRRPAHADGRAGPRRARAEFMTGIH